MTDFYVKNRNYSLAADHRSEWQANETWPLGARVTPTTDNGLIYECTTGGAGGAVEPTWGLVVGGTTNDGSAVWTARNFTSWANAAWKLEQVDGTVSVGGDTVYIAHGYDLQQGLLATFTSSNAAAPVRLMPTRDTTNEPPLFTADSSGEPSFTIGSPTGNGMNMAGNVYVVGLTTAPGSGTSAVAALNLGTTLETIQTYENCTLTLNNTDSSSRIIIGSGSLPDNQEIRFVDCDVGFKHASQGFTLYSDLHWNGGSVLVGAGYVAPNTLFGTVGGLNQAVKLLIENVDFSACSSSMVLLATPGASTLLLDVTFKNCIFPSGWADPDGFVTGSNIIAGYITTAAMRVKLTDYTVDGVNHRSLLRTSVGYIYCVSDISAEDGASDGERTMSWYMSKSTSLDHLDALATDELIAYKESSAAQTVTVEIMSAIELLARDVWLEVSGSGFFASSRRTQLDATTALSVSTRNWTVTTERQDSTAVGVGDAFAIGGRVWVCTSPGTTASSQPAGYATANDGDTITDGTADFESLRRYELTVTAPSGAVGRIVGRVVQARQTYVYVDPLLRLT